MTLRQRRDRVVLRGVRRHVHGRVSVRGVVPEGVPGPVRRVRL
jgi:hypothetical protein